MYKAGKNWLFAGIGVITLASTVAMTTPNAHAAELNNDTNLSSTQKDEQKVTSATPAQQAAIDDAQKDVDQDNADITQNQKNTADEQANHDILTDQTAGKQSDVDQAQADADKANDQVDKDKSASMTLSLLTIKIKKMLNNRLKITLIKPKMLSIKLLLIRIKLKRMSIMHLTKLTKRKLLKMTLLKIRPMLKIKLMQLRIKLIIRTRQLKFIMTLHQLNQVHMIRVML